LIEKPTNIRYNVAQHPKPQADKKIYQYDRFPSIISKVAIKETDINIQVDSVNEDELELLE
jgi:hypothetical protein